MVVATDRPDSQGEVWLRSVVLASWKTLADPVQASPGHRSASDLDDLFDEPNLGGSGDDGRPGQPHEGLSLSGLTPAQRLSPNVAYLFPNFSFDDPMSMSTLNQERNPSSHTTALSHPWDFATSNDLLDNLGQAPLFSTTGYGDPASLTGLMPQNPFSSAGHSQSDDFQFGDQLMDGT